MQPRHCSTAWPKAIGFKREFIITNSFRVGQFVRTAFANGNVAGDVDQHGEHIVEIAVFQIGIDGHAHMILRGILDQLMG